MREIDTLSTRKPTRLMNDHVIRFYQHMCKECCWLQRKALSYDTAKYWDKQAGSWYLRYLSEAQYDMFQ
jgi:hypothetical protein